MGGGVPSICASSADKAQDISVADAAATDCDLPDPVNDANFFKFTGTKGEVVWISTTAKTGKDKFDTSFLDTVVTLYDAQMNQIARNDDPSPRYTNDAQLFTVLPANGDYFIEVQECNAVFGTQSCADAAAITTLTYKIQIVDVQAGPDFTFDAEPNDVSTMATAIGYSANPSGGYFLSTVHGTFGTATDVDVYSFSIPTDVTVSQGRPLGNISPFPWGTDGDGATSSIGKIWIVDPADLAHHVAEVDVSVGMTPGDLSVPLTFGKQYFLFVNRATGSAGTNDFYFFNHDGGGSNPVEAANATNGVATTPEVLTDLMDNPAFLATYFVDGDISATGDVDFYELAIPAGGAKMSASCGAQRSGSGLRGLKMSLTQPNGTLLSAAATTGETAATDATLSGISVAGMTKVLLKVEAASQDSIVTSTFYRCGARVE
jgi:hypothetical protein